MKIEYFDDFSIINLRFALREENIYPKIWVINPGPIQSIGTGFYTQIFSIAVQNLRTTWCQCQGMLVQSEHTKYIITSSYLNQFRFINHNNFWGLENVRFYFCLFKGVKRNFKLLSIDTTINVTSKWLSMDKTLNVTSSCYPLIQL